MLQKDNPKDRMFAILPNCEHCYCVECVRTWRKVKNLPNKVVKGCPMCRQVSHFYVPSKYWVEDDKKVYLLKRHTKYLATLPCVYYQQGACRYGSKCMYGHSPDPEQEPSSQGPRSARGEPLHGLTHPQNHRHQTPLYRQEPSSNGHRASQGVRGADDYATFTAYRTAALLNELSNS